MSQGIFAFYDGDNFIVSGTVKEIADFLEIKEKTVRWYRSPSAQRLSNRKLVQVSERAMYGFDDINIEKIKELRTEFDYSFDEMGEIIGKTGQAYRYKEAKKSRFDHNDIEEIADLFFVDVEDLLAKESVG